jgi:hypothetical protein
VLVIALAVTSAFAAVCSWNGAEAASPTPTMLANEAPLGYTWGDGE